MKNGLVKDGDEINCRKCFYGNICTVARGHNYKVGSCFHYEETKITNGDKIRNMTDEKLAEWFDSMISCCDCNDFPCRQFCEGRTCSKAWLEWLKQEGD